MQKHELVEKLRDIFRRYGYDGASLSVISQETGLTRSSLYHYFPMGKEQMATEALQLALDSFSKELTDITSSDNDARSQAIALAAMLERYYQQGHQGCILLGLTMTQQPHIFQANATKLADVWLDTMIQIAEHSGQDKAQATKRANQVICLVEGSLVMVKITNSNQLFLDVIQDIPELLAPQ